MKESAWFAPSVVLKSSTENRTSLYSKESIQLVEKLEPQDPWHYPRPKLAEKYLKVFDIGLIAAQGLFAKRRLGPPAGVTKMKTPPGDTFDFDQYISGPTNRQNS
jgi:hypothetical protein